jgi:hypothetical protein
VFLCVTAGASGLVCAGRVAKLLPRPALAGRFRHKQVSATPFLFWVSQAAVLVGPLGSNSGLPAQTLP